MQFRIALAACFLSVAAAFPNAFVDLTVVGGAVYNFTFSCPAGEFINLFQFFAANYDDTTPNAAYAYDLQAQCYNGAKGPTTKVNAYTWPLGCHHFAGIQGSFNRTCRFGPTKTSACLTSLRYVCYRDAEYAGARLYRNETFSQTCPGGQYISGLSGKRTANQIIDVAFNCSTPDPAISDPPVPKMAVYYLNTQYYAGPRLWQLDLSRFDYVVYGFFWYDQYGVITLPDPYPVSQYLNNTVTDGGCACCLQGDMGQFMALKRTRWPHLKVIAGFGPVGDWSAQQTANVLGTKTLLNATATSVAVNQTTKMILDYGFDGLDFDWEWPSSAGQVALASAMYARVRAQLRAANPTYNYTFKCTVGDANNFASAVGVFDYLQTMTYQMGMLRGGLTRFEQSTFLPENERLNYNWDISASVETWKMRNLMYDHGWLKRQLFFGISPRLTYVTGATSATTPFSPVPPGGSQGIVFWGATFAGGSLPPGSNRTWPGAGMQTYLFGSPSRISLAPDPINAAYKQGWAQAKGYGGSFLFHVGSDAALAPDVRSSFMKSMSSVWPDKTPFGSNTSDLTTPSNLCSPVSIYCNIRCGATCSQLAQTFFCTATARASPAKRNSLLVFTGGPSPRTPLILAQLAASNLKALFFLDYSLAAVPANQGYVQQIVRAGHDVGHFLGGLGAANVSSVLNAADSTLLALIGRIPNLIRMGYNTTDAAVCSAIQQHGYAIVTPSLSAYDTACLNSGSSAACMSGNVTAAIGTKVNDWIMEFAESSFATLPASVIASNVAALAAKNVLVNTTSQCFSGPTGPAVYSGVGPASACDRTAIPYASTAKTGCAALLFSGGLSALTATNAALLDARNVNATFYVAGSTLTSNAKQTLLRGMLAAGHQIGHNGWNYASMLSLTDAQVAVSLLRSDAALAAYLGTGKTPTSVLPPGGFLGSGCAAMQAMGYNLTQYSVNLDTTQASPMAAFNASLRQALAQSSSPIVVLTDGDAATTATLNAVVDALQANGLRVSTLADCIADPAPYRPSNLPCAAANATVAVSAANAPNVTCADVTSGSLGCASNLVVTSCAAGSQLALTFTGGPDFNFESLIANVAGANISAAFFIQGSQMQLPYFGAMAKDAVALGHIIGSATYDYLPLLNMTTAQVNAEVDRADLYIQDQLNVRPNYVRPPYGVYDDASCYALQTSSHRMVTWSLVLSDSAASNATQLLADFAQAVQLASSPQAASLVIAADPTFAGYINNGSWIFAEMAAIAAQFGYSFVDMATCVGDSPTVGVYRNASYTAGDGHCYPAAENCTNTPQDCGACPSRSLFAQSNAEADQSLQDVFYGSPQKYVLFVMAGAVALSILARLLGGISALRPAGANAMVRRKL